MVGYRLINKRRLAIPGGASSLTIVVTGHPSGNLYYEGGGLPGVIDLLMDVVDGDELVIERVVG